MICDKFLDNLGLFQRLSVMYESIIDKKFKQAEEEGHKIQEIDKEHLKEDLMGKYKQLVSEIEKVGEAKTIEEKINRLIDRLEKIDKLEYKEIIEALKEKVKEKEMERGNKKPSL